MPSSKKYNLNAEDAKSIGRGALIATGGALIVYVAEVVPAIEFGAYTPVAVALAGIILNTARKILADYSSR